MDEKSLPSSEGRLTRFEGKVPAQADLLPFPDQEEERIDIKQYLQILRRYSWVILTFLTITVVTAVVWTFTQRPIYTASATIRIEQEEPRIVKYEPVVPPDYRQRGQETQYMLIKSPSLAKRVIDSLNLAADPEFQPSPPGWMARVKDFVLTLSPQLGRWISVTTPVPGEVAGVEKSSYPVSALLSRLIVEPISRTSLVNVSFESYSPALSAQVANAIADTYIIMSREQRLGATEYAVKFLSQQLEETRQKLEESEARLSEFLRSKNIGIFPLPGSSKDLTQQQVSPTDALYKVRIERVNKEALLVQARSLDLDLFPATLQDQAMVSLRDQLLKLEAEYRKLMETYKPEFPKMLRLKQNIEDVRRQFRAEAQRVVGNLEAEVQLALSREKEIEKGIQQMTSDLVQYNLLKREVDTNREIYSNLHMRLKETGITSALATTNIQVVDRATAPLQPSKPNKLRNILLALMFGLGGGVGFAFLFAYLDTKLRSPKEVEQAIHLPIMGMIPTLASVQERSRRKGEEGGKGPFALITHHDGVSPISEAFRHVRTSLLFSTPEHPPRTILFTSLEPQEGKTSVALNTAITLAQLGGKVLMVDADMRNPKVHSILGISQTPGLSDFLTGQAELPQVIKPSQIHDLYTIPAGHPNPADLLASERIRVSLDLLTQQFRHVVFDTSPLLLASDPLILASRVEGVILVFRNGWVHRETAQHAVKLLRSVHARLLGVVINDVDIRELRTYGYSSYYPYYYYGPYRQDKS